jgi:hypothetical protein
MHTDAWVFMLSSWTVITFMTAYCFYKLLTSPRRFGEE